MKQRWIPAYAGMTKRKAGRTKKNGKDEEKNRKDKEKQKGQREKKQEGQKAITGKRTIKTKKKFYHLSIKKRCELSKINVANWLS